MAKHTQTICRLLSTNFLSVFDHFVGLVLEGLVVRPQKIDLDMSKNQVPRVIKLQSHSFNTKM